MAGPKKILLVEDDNNLREIYGARLQAEGYDIVSAPDGENALAIAVKEKPDLIISDIMMPKVSGFDMLDILRNAPETKDTKIIMMTALSQAEDKARADKLGADMYLVKSQVTLEDVAKAVHQILDDPSESTQEAESAAAQEMVSGKPKPDEKPEEAPVEQAAPPVAQPPEPQPEPEVQPAPVEPEPQNNNEPISPVAVPPAPAQTDSPAATPIEQPTPEEQVKPAEPSPTPEPVPDENPTVESSSSVTSIPVSAPDEDASPLAVEPSLAQALEDEEKALQEKIGGSEKTEPEAPDTISPASPPEDQAVESKPPPKDPLDDRPSKRVIEPINDPTKAPDINELIAKEEAKELGESNGGMDQASQVIKPEISEDSGDQSPGDSQSSTDSKEDFGKISL
ncbi:MAG: response regulator [Candidatus Saccharimonadales bacterium]